MIKKAFFIALNNIRGWICNPRYWILFLIVSVFIYQDNAPLFNMVVQTGVKINPLIFPLYISNHYFQFILMIGVIFLFSDAPFINENQPYIIMRAGKKSWVLGQVFYIFIAAAIYITIAMAISVIILLSKGTFATDGWGKIINTLAITNAQEVIGLVYDVSEKVVNNFTPFQAFFITYVLEWLIASILGLIMFALNLFTKINLGTFVAMFLALLDLLIANVLPWGLYSISPVSLGRIVELDWVKMSYLPTVRHAFIFLISLAITLVIWIISFAHNQTIETKPTI